MTREISNLKEGQIIDIDVFSHLTKMTDSLLNPAFDLQFKLIDFILGPEFWLRHKKRRCETYGSRRYLRVNDICFAYKQKKGKLSVPVHLQVQKDALNNANGPATTSAPPPSPSVPLGTVAASPVAPPQTAPEGAVGVSTTAME